MRTMMIINGKSEGHRRNTERHMLFPNTILLGGLLGRKEGRKEEKGRKEGKERKEGKKERERERNAIKDRKI